MIDATITCPKCKTEFPLTESLAASHRTNFESRLSDCEKRGVKWN